MTYKSTKHSVAQPAGEIVPALASNTRIVSSRKFVFLVVVLILARSSHCAPAPTPTISPAPTARQEIWIAIRKDKKHGSGTRVDPLDGSSATGFDALMRASGPFTTVHLGRGAFSTNGVQDGPTGFVLKKGQQIIGAGRNLTTVKLMHCFQFAGHRWYEGDAFVHPYDVDGSDSLVADLTIDLNSDYFATQLGVSAYKLTAVALRSRNCSIRNVHVIHAHGDWKSGLEAFTLWVGGFYDGTAWQPVVNATIEKCLVDQSSLDYGCAIAVINQANISDFGKNLGGVVRNNVVKNWAGTSAYGFLGRNIEFMANSAIDCSLFVYGDTGASDHIIIRGNTASCGLGNAASASGLTGFVFFNKSSGASFKNVVIENNAVTVRPTTNSDGTTGLLALAGAAAGLGSDYLVQNNHLSMDTRSSATRYVAWQIDGVDRISFSGNVFDRTPRTRVGTNVTNLTVSP